MGRTKDWKIFYTHSKSTASLLIHSVRNLLISLIFCISFTSVLKAQISRFEKEVILKIVLGKLKEQGFLDAKIQIQNDSIWIEKGIPYQTNQISVLPKDDYSDLISQALLPFKKQNLSNELKENIINKTKQFLIEQGQFLSSIQFSVELIDTVQKTVDIQLIISNKGDQNISKVQFSGDSTYSETFLKRLAGIQTKSLSLTDLEKARNRLNRTNLFKSISDYQLFRTEKGVIADISLVKQNPNQFDVVVGYVPNPAGGGDIVGTIDADLINAIAEGNQIKLYYTRMQALRSRLQLGFKQLYLLGSPISIGFDLNIFQRDSTFQTRDIQISGGTELGINTSINAFIRQESNAKGSAFNSEITNGNAFFYGFDYSYNSTNDLFIPTSGIHFNLRTDFGFKTNDLDSTNTVFLQKEDKQRLFTQFDYYASLNRHVFKTSVFSHFQLTNFFQDTDLFRFGGAKTFRGYTEEQFAVSKVAWLDVEYRFLIDPTTYLFSFTTNGWMETPDLLSDVGIRKGFTQFLTSFGLGLAYQTRIGLLTFTYAKSVEDSFDNAKIHFSVKGRL